MSGLNRRRSTCAASAGSALPGALLIGLIGCGGPAPTPPVVPDPPPAVAVEEREAPAAVGRLLGLMGDRLALMHDVARTKWNAKRPVGDPPREEALLKEMEEAGRSRGLDPQFVRGFFAAQITAARSVQEADFARWQAQGQGSFEGAPALGTLRQQIDALNRKLLDALAEARPLLGQGATGPRLEMWSRQTLRGDGITDEIRTTALEGLRRP